jgi:uncharacterized protein YjbI with pentapeptide repeats
VPGADAIEWDEAAFDAALKRVAADGAIDARGVRLSADQLRRLLDAAPEDPQRPGRRLLHVADFSGATFSGDADFIGATFGGTADFGRATFGGTFGRATFGGTADFSGATFGDYADFSGATFGGRADFRGASFGGRADFREAGFGGIANFGGASFSGDASFPSTIFSGDALFEGVTFAWRASFKDSVFAKATFAGDKRVTFKEWAVFEYALFTGDAWFGGAAFEQRAMFGGATFKGQARFEGATFAAARSFGPLDVGEGLLLDRASFLAPVTVELNAQQVSCHFMRFAEGVNLRVGRGDVALDESQFGRPSIVAGPTDGRQPAVRPRVVSVRQADVGNLVLANVDLSACLFAGAHNLDGVRIEGPSSFPSTPAGWWPDGSRFPWRWSRRRTIAEEQEWRARPPRPKSGWHPLERWPPQWLVASKSLPDVEELDAGQIAGIYRGLRKGREDNKDAPGAADFYYGEMEMRRHAAKAGRRIRGIPGIEEAVLWLYWLVSGYGLRASRAVVALAITIALGAVLLSLFGFDEGERPEGGALLFAAESSISLLRAPNSDILTDGGNVVQIALRLAGPLFFGLALLSLRGRVKR